MSNANQDFDVDALLDGTLDDLADLPEFRPYIPGTHRVTYTIEKDKKLKTVYYGKMKLLETMEQSNAEDKPLEVGAEAAIRYDLTNDYGQGAFKKVLSIAAEKFGAKANRELIDDMKNVECLVVTKLVESKKTAGQFFTDIVEMQIV